MTIPEQCGAVCQQLVCDREAGHVGPHRGYDAQIDEALFWHDRRSWRLRPDTDRPAHWILERERDEE